MQSNIHQPSTPIQNNNQTVTVPCLKSLNQQNAYRLEVLGVLRTAIAQRTKLVRMGKGNLKLQDSHLTVIREFGYLQDKCKSAGLASYIFRHADTIRQLIPGSNPTLKQRFDELVFEAPNYFN